jgi:hypothetical protein
MTLHALWGRVVSVVASTAAVVVGSTAEAVPKAPLDGARRLSDLLLGEQAGRPSHGV